MIDDITMLKTITETADMGRDSLNHVLDKTSDSNLKDALLKQLAQYDSTYKEAERILEDKGKSPDKIGAPLKLYSHMVSNFKTMTSEDSTSKIAEMVIQGSTMGVTEMTKQLNAYQTENNEIRHLAKEFIKTEENNVKEMQKFL